MENLAIYIVLVTNLLCAAVLVSIFKKRVNGKQQEESAAKNTYTLTATCIGVILSLFGNYIVNHIYQSLKITTSYGHGGEALSFFLSFFVNVLLTVFIVIIGRSLIGWKLIQW